MAVGRTGQGWRLGGVEDAAGLSGAWHALRGPAGEARPADAAGPRPLDVDSNGDGFEDVIDLTGLASRPAVGFIIQGRADFHYAGSSVSSAGDVNGDGYDDMIVGAVFGDEDGFDAGQAYVVFGKAGGFGTIDAADLGTAGFLIQGVDGGDNAGRSVSSAGDVNGDGFDDIIVGAPFHYDPSDRHGGDAYVIFGKATEFGTVDLAGLASRPAEGFVIHANEVGDLAGYSVSGAGDVNGDGFDDLIVGAWQAGEDQYVGGADHGEVYVIFGKAAEFSEVYLSTLDPAEDGYDPAAGFMIAAPGSSPSGFGSDFDAVGFSVSGAGDVNDDGYDDIIVGAPYSGGYSGNGAAAVLFGKADGFSDVDLNSLAAEDGFLIIGASGDYAGMSVSSAGDVNGDGFDEVIVGAPLGGVTGRAYVIFGKASGFGTIDLASLGSAGFTILGDANLDYAGMSVSSAGDVNGDGYDDIIIGAPHGDDGGSLAGEAYVVFGKADGFGTVDLTNLGNSGFVIQGDRIGDQAGASVSAAGDVNGDGYDDIIVGAPRGDAGADIAGAAYVIFGQQPAQNLIGTPGDDELVGGNGYDTLNGAGGADRMEGRGGNDTYYVDNEGDLVIEAANEGRDAVYTTISWALTGDSHVEVVSTAALGGTEALNLTGNGLAQEIYGNAGANLLNGGGGADQLFGLGGDDSYLITDGSEQIFETAGNGRDVAYTSVSHVLGAGVHVEIFSTTSLAGTAALNLTGNELAQEIYGNAGANVLNGGGGADQLIGVGGDDVYFITSGAEQIIETAGNGRDVAYASVSHVLGAGIHVEILSTTSLAGTAALNLTGNELAQEIYGNAGANVLNGGGGADLLIGVGGDDVYFITGGAEQIIEVAGNGRDVAYASVSHALGAGISIEVLSTTSLAGTAALNFTGNELAQEIYGNAGANTLNGGGGADLLIGVGGDDVYFITSGAEQIIEAAGEGRDVVYASVNHTLGAGVHVEILSAASFGGIQALDLTGNELAQEIYGNAGANVLNGGGGSDYLIGGNGADSFAFTTALGGGNVDALLDFSAADDTILLDNAVFAGLADGALNANAFVAGSAAADADDRIVYNSATGQLYFDADGSGAAAQMLFATLNAGQILAASDFTVI